METDNQQQKLNDTFLTYWWKITTFSSTDSDLIHHYSSRCMGFLVLCCVTVMYYSSDLEKIGFMNTNYYDHWTNIIDWIFPVNKWIIRINTWNNTLFLHAWMHPNFHVGSYINNKKGLLKRQSTFRPNFTSHRPTPLVMIGGRLLGIEDEGLNLFF